LLSPSTLAFSQRALSAITDWSAEREDRHIGFGEAVNYLFARVSPESCFLLINPDAMPMPGCIDRLVSTFCERNAAMVEARQWPSEHPKEYDSDTGWTPWASGAFVLIASQAFRRLNGFDPLYFLYNEDVDLSWRAWLAGMPVIYEPRAICAHFTGLLSYRPTRFYYEQFFSIRNFLLIAYKFFGEAGENAARRWIEDARLPTDFRARVEESYLQLRDNVQPVKVSDACYADKIKILGLNLYHELRRI
jgi:GT2 family glycosyltransferase